MKKKWGFKKISIFFLCLLNLLLLVAFIFGNEQLFSKKPQNESDLFLLKMYDAYNRKNLDEYSRFFDQEINVTKEQGLGSTRIISGQREFKAYYENVFRTKRGLKLTFIESFAVPPWILVKELIEHEDKIYEAAVGYRIEKDKIIHKIILSDRFVYNRKILFDTQ